MIRKVEEKPITDLNAFHLAGIIPLCGQQYRDKTLPWHPAMLPLNEDAMLIDVAIAQCAYVGCKSIWIVLDSYMEEFFKRRIGEWVEDPIHYKSDVFQPGVKSDKRAISVFYVPEHFDDRDKRDSVSYQVIRGIEMARKVTGQISTFLTPDKYFVTFPYSILDLHEMQKFRPQIYTEDNFIFTSNGKSIKTGEYYPFTITHKLAKRCKEWVWQNATGIRDMSQPKEEWQFGSIPTKTLPPEEQYNGRWFGPDKVFHYYLETGDYIEKELPWIYDCSTFDGYKEFLKTDKSLPYLSKKLFRGRTWNSMSFDDIEFGDDIDDNEEED